MVTSTDANNSPVQSAAPLLAEHAKNAGFASVSAMIEAIFEALPADRRLLQAKTVTGILRTKYCKQLSEDILHKELQLVLDLLVKEGKVCIKSSFYEWIRVGWSDTQLDPIHNLVKEGWRLNQAYSPHIGKEFRLFYESNRWLDGHIIGILPKYGGNMPSTWYLFQDDFSHDHPIAIPEDILQPLLSYQQETCIPQSIFDKLYRFYPKLLDWIVQLRMDLFGNHVVLCLVKTGFLLMAFDGLDSAAITLNIKKTKIIDHFVSGEFHGCVKFEILKRSIWLEKIKTEGMVRNVDLAVLRCLLDPATASYYTEGYPFPTEKDDLIRFRQTNGWNSLVDCSSLQGDLLRRFHGPSHAAEVLEISPNGILQAIQQRTAYAGFYWQYTVSSKDKHGNIVSSKKSLYVPVLILRAMMVVGESKLIKSNCTASIPTSFSTAPTNLITNDSTNEDSKSGVDNKLCYRVGCYSVDGVLLYVFSNPLVAAQSVLGNVSVILLSAYHWHLSCAHRGFLWKFEEMNTPSTASPTTLHLEHLLSFANFPLQGLDPKHVFRVHTDAELEAIESNNAKNKGKSIENTSNNVYLEGMTAHPFIGLKVRRFFSGSFSDGMVKTFLPAERNDGIPFWHIRHDDNDEEDLELLEVLESLYYIRHQVRDKRVRWSLALGRSSLNANDNFIGGSAFQDQLFLELKRRPLQEIVDAFSMEDIHQRLCKDIPVQLCTNLTNQSDGKILMLLYNLIHQISQTNIRIKESGITPLQVYGALSTTTYPRPCDITLDQCWKYLEIMVSMKILTSISIWWELGRIENGYSYVYNDKYFLASFSSQAITSSNSKGEISKIVATKSANATSSNKPVQGQIKDSTISLNYTTASSSSSSNTAPLPSTAAPKQQAINPQAALNNKTLNGNSNPILDNFKETIECMTVEGKHLGYFNDLNELARQTGVRRSVIYMISMKKQRTSKGLSFRIVKPSAATTVTEVEKEGWYELIRQHLRDYEINPAHYVAINVRSRMPTSSANRLSLGSPKKKTRAVVNREAEEDSEELNSEEDDEDEFEFKDPRIGDIYQIEVPPFVPPTEAMKHLASTASNDCVNKLFPIVPGPEGIPQIAMETSAQYQQALQKLFYLYKLMHCIPGMILPIAAKANNQFVTFRHAVILHHRNEYTMSTMIRVACAEHASIDLFLDAMKASLTEYDLEGMFPWLVYDGKMVQEISLSHLVLCDEDIVMESLHRCQGKLEDTFLLLFEHVRMKYLQIWSEDEVKTYRKHLPSTKLEENDLARCYRKHIETKSTTRSWKEFVAFHHQYSLLHHPHQNKSIKKRQEALANVFRASSFIRNFVLAPDHQHDEILQWDQRVWAALGRSHFSSYASNVFVSSTSSSVPTTNSSSSSSDTIFLPSEVPLDSKDGISLPEVAKEEDKEDDEDVGVEDSGESEHSANFREPLKLKSKTKSISGAIDTTSSKPEASKSLTTSDDIVGKVMLRLKRKIEDISSSPNQTITPSIMTSKSVDTTTTIANPTSIEQSKKLSAASSVQISPEKTSDLSLGASNNGGNNSKSTQPMKKNELPLVSKAIAASTTVSSKPIIESNNKTISTNSPFLAKKSLLLQSANFANVEYASPANTSGNRGGSSEGNVVESTKNPWPTSTNELETDEKLICQDRKFRNFMLYIHGQQSVTLLNTLCKEHKWTSALMSKLPVAFREEALKIAHGIDAHLVFKHSIVYFRPQYYPNNNSPSSYANLQANRHYFLTYDAVKNYLLHLFSLIPSLPNQKNSLMQVVKTSPAAVVPVAAITNTNTNTTAITTAPPAATTTPSPAEVIIGRYRMSQAIGSAIPADKFPLFVEACLQDGFEMVTSSIYPTNDWIANFKALKAMGWKHMPLATGEFFFKTSKIFQQVGNSKEAWKAQEGVNIFVGRQQVEEYLQVKWISQGLVYFTRNRKTGLISSSLHTQLGVDFVSVVDETVKPTTTSIASFPTSSSDNTKINLPMPLPLPIPIKISTTSSSSTTPIAPPVQSTLQSVEIATMSRNATHMFTIVDFLYQCQDLVVTKLHTKETESILDYNASVTTAILEYLKIIIQSCQTLSDHPQDLVKYFNLVAKLTFKNVMEYSMSQIAHVVQDESKHAVATIFLKKSNLIVPSQVLQSTKQALQSIFHEYGNVIRGLLQLEQRGTRLVVNIPKSTALQIFYRTEGQAVELEARSRELPRMRKHVFQVAKVFTEMFMDKILSAHDSVLFAQCKEWSMRLSTLQDPTDINNFLLALEQRPVYMCNLDGLQSMMELVHALQETKARTSNLFDRFVSKQQYASAWLHRMKSSHFPSGAVDPLTTIDAAGSAEGLLQVKASFCEWIENGLEPKYWDPFDTDL